jgi:hypothetical protein
MKKSFLIAILLCALPSFAARGFNGTTQAITGSNCCFTMASGSTVSVAAWVNMASTGSYATIAEFDNNQFPGFFSYGLNLNSTGHPEAWIVGNGAPVRLTWGTALTANVWYHIGLTWDSASTLLRLYVNGTQVATGVSGATAAGANLPLGVGGAYNAGCCQNFLHGSIAEQAAWDIVLTPTEMNALAHGSPPSLVRPSRSSGDAHMLSYWPMHGLSTTMEPNFTNVTSNNQNGSFTGAPPQAPHCPCGMPTGEGH